MLSVKRVVVIDDLTAAMGLLVFCLQSNRRRCLRPWIYYYACNCNFIKQSSSFKLVTKAGRTY